MARRRERRDWSSLPDHILDSISDSLLSEDITEYIRFRMVCSWWRQSTAPPSNIESRFRPRDWILLTFGQLENFSRRRRIKDPCCLFNVSNGNYLQVYIPHFRQGYTPISVVDGLLVLLKKKTGELCLLHPFSLSLTELPNVDSLLSIVRTIPNIRNIQHVLSSVNFLSSTVIVFCFKLHHKVVFATIGGDKWIGLDDRVSCFSTVSFHGKLYAAEYMTGAVVQFELEEVQNGSGVEPKLSMKILFLPTFGYHFYHGLLEFEGQILLLRQNNMVPSEKYCFELYKVDVENCRLIPTSIPCDRTFFASESRCLSVSTSSVSPSLLLPQSIYYYRMHDPYMTVYHSHRPNLQPTHFYRPHYENIYRLNGRPRDKQIGPYSFPSYLICHCANFHMPPDSLLV